MGVTPAIGIWRKRYPSARPSLRSPVSAQNATLLLYNCSLASFRRQRLKHLSRRGQCIESENLKNQHSTDHYLTYCEVLHNFCCEEIERHIAASGSGVGPSAVSGGGTPLWHNGTDPAWQRLPAGQSDVE